MVGDSKTYYMVTTGGGVWKTENMGISWRNVSDGSLQTGTIGAIAVAESDRNVVYVGTGEVWDMRHIMMAVVPGVYIEANYRGHKASPGRYRIAPKQGDKTVTTEATILPNPLYTTDAATYAEYDAFMSGMERELSGMHETVNTLTDQRDGERPAARQPALK